MNLPIPAVVVQVLLGILLAGTGLLRATSELQAIANVGLVLMLFSIGTEVDLRAMGRAAAPTAAVATLGVVFSLAAGIGAGLLLGWPILACIFAGGVLSATSIAISAKALDGYGWLQRDEGRTVLGAAVLDDVIGLLTLGIVLTLAGSEGIGGVVWQVGAAIGLVAVALAGGLFMSNLLSHKVAGSLPGFSLGAAACLSGALLASQIGLEPFLGSFLAGAVLPSSMERHLTMMNKAGALLAPLYFVLLGTHVPIREFLTPQILLTVAVLGVAGIVAKLASGLGAPGRWNRTVIGLAMVPRGEVGMVFAAAGLSAGALTSTMYSGLVGAALVTSVCGPILLQRQLASGFTTTPSPVGNDRPLMNPSR
jgi:Kef-type K+ transport system membrane component KefB